MFSLVTKAIVARPGAASMFLLNSDNGERKQGQREPGKDDHLGHGSVSCHDQYKGGKI